MIVEYCALQMSGLQSSQKFMFGAKQLKHKFNVMLTHSYKWLYGDAAKVFGVGRKQMISEISSTV